ncbi:MAG: hypothetical protein ACPGQS_06445 [Bradymonadia bacterium]
MSLGISYEDYLSRFEQLVGSVEVGQVGSFKGKLVKKLSAERFDELSQYYSSLIEKFNDMVQRAETIDERVMMGIRRTELELLVEKSPVLP